MNSFTPETLATVPPRYGVGSNNRFDSFYSFSLSAGLCGEKGFTLLEVMIALAIMAGVVVTVLGSANFHLDVMQAEHDTTALTLLARFQLETLEQAGVVAKGTGTFAPVHPDVIWTTELFPTRLPALQKLVLKVQRTGDKREVMLVRYVLK